jgi:Secretion system C-terminal sorting domain
MKTKLYSVLISIFIVNKVYCQIQDTVPINPEIDKCIHMQYFSDTCFFQFGGDTLKIYGKFWKKGCGKQIALINKSSDSIIIFTTEIPPDGADCNLIVNSCFEIKVPKLPNYTYIKFDGKTYNIISPVIEPFVTSVNNPDTISYNLLNPNCSPDLNFKYIDDTLVISGTVEVVGCGRQVAIISHNNDSTIIHTKEIVPPGGPDCYSAHDACFEMKVPNATNDSVLIFNGNAYKLETLSKSIIASVSDIADAYIKEYPNPTYGPINIDFQKTNLQNCLLEIYNLSGESLLSKEMKGSDRVNIDSFKSGCYILYIKENNDVVLRKLILKR